MTHWLRAAMTVARCSLVTVIAQPNQKALTGGRSEHVITKIEKRPETGLRHVVIPQLKRNIFAVVTVNFDL